MRKLLPQETSEGGALPTVSQPSRASDFLAGTGLGGALTDITQSSFKTA